MIFAVLYVSLDNGSNTEKTYGFFCINTCC